jgi:hypothetical protein
MGTKKSVRNMCCVIMDKVSKPYVELVSYITIAVKMPSL